MDLFSLNGRRLLSKSGWHDNRQMPTLAFPCLFGLRTACLSGVRKVSGRRGMTDRKAFVRCTRIVSFYRRLVLARNEAFSWGWNCRFDSLSECELKNGWENFGRQIPLFCWWVWGKRISLLLWKDGEWFILAAIMQLEINTAWLFTIGFVFVLLAVVFGCILFVLSNKKTN